MSYCIKYCRLPSIIHFHNCSVYYLYYAIGAGIGYYSGWPDDYYGYTGDQHNGFSPAGYNLHSFYIILLLLSPITDILQNIIQFSENLRRGPRNRYCPKQISKSYLNLVTRASFSAGSLYVFDILYNRCLLQIYAEQRKWVISIMKIFLL